MCAGLRGDPREEPSSSRTVAGTGSPTKHSRSLKELQSASHMNDSVPNVSISTSSFSKGLGSWSDNINNMSDEM